MKKDFKNILKYGKCEGRGQLDKQQRISPLHCVSGNAGIEPHKCPDDDGFWMVDECNCCVECMSRCAMAKRVRTVGQEESKSAFEKWKRYLGPTDKGN